MEGSRIPMSRPVIPAMLERKKSFLIAAFGLLPEFEARLDHNENHTYPFVMLINTLEEYPTGIFPAQNKAKSLIYCADATVFACLATLCSGDLKAVDIVSIGEMLESALDNICSLETHYML